MFSGHNSVVLPHRNLLVKKDSGCSAWPPGNILAVRASTHPLHVACRLAPALSTLQISSSNDLPPSTHPPVLHDQRTLHNNRCRQTYNRVIHPIGTAHHTVTILRHAVHLPLLSFAPVPRRRTPSHLPARLIMHRVYPRRIASMHWIPPGEATGSPRRTAQPIFNCATDSCATLSDCVHGRAEAGLARGGESARMWTWCPAEVGELRARVHWRREGECDGHFGGGGYVRYKGRWVGLLRPRLRRGLSNFGGRSEDVDVHVGVVVAV